jgi:predicted carbohydrate-binding protein with CBM5 and CBM33 domain
MTLPLLASVKLLILLMTLYCGGGVSAHGYLKTPRSRNLVAFEDLNWETYLGGTGGTKLCSHKGCPNHAKKGGVCITHGAKVERKQCSFEGCTNHVQKGGVCIMHGAYTWCEECTKVI